MFEGGAHARVADAIRDLIMREAGGRVIGLQGEWGSGKSTIVSLLNSACAESSLGDSKSVTKVAVFDAWAHQDDPLRRTFLESLLSFVEEWKWLTPEQCKDYRDRLTGRVKTNKVKSTARLTQEGIWTSVSLLAVPVGIAMFGNKFSQHHRLVIYIGLALMLLPLLVVACFEITRFVLNKRFPKGSPKKWQRAIADPAPFTYFAKDQQTTTTTESLEEAEPTSVEFEEYFNSILEDAITDERRLLIVLDNLDRVGEDDARAVFATMQTFTGTSATRANEAWRGRVWTLIPYDRTGLEHLWSRDGEPVDDASCEVPTRTSVTDAYLEKLFEVTFVAPPLLLSDWRSYLLELLREALPGRPTSELHPIVTLRALYPAASPNHFVASETPTPRQLKQFVNEIGSFTRQRADIPLVDIAYYVLLCRDRFVVPEALLNSDQRIPHPSVRHMFGAEARRNLAALHYGTSTKLAGQLLLSSRLLPALANGDADVVRAVSSEDGFVDAVESLDVAAWTTTGAVEMARYVAVLDKAGALRKLSDWKTQTLLPIARRVAQFNLAGAASGHGIAVICLEARTPAPDMESRVADVQIETRDQVPEVVEGMAALAAGLRKNQQLSAAVRVRVYVRDEDLVSFLAALRRATDLTSAYAAVSLDQTAEAVADAIATSITSDAPHESLDGLAVLRARSNRVDLDRTRARVASWLREGAGASDSEVSAAIGVLDSLASKLPPASELDDVAGDGTLMHQFWRAYSQSWWDSAAGASILQLLARSPAQEPTSHGDSIAGFQTFREVLRSPGSHESLVAAQSVWLGRRRAKLGDLLLQRLEDDPEIEPWIDLQLRVLNSQKPMDISAPQFLKSWSALHRALGTDFAAVALRMLKNPNKRKTLLSSTDPRFASVLLEAVQDPNTNGEARAAVSAWAADIVRAATKLAWLEDFDSASDGGPLVSLADELLEAGVVLNSPVHLDDAIRDYARVLQDGNGVWMPNSSDFIKLANTLDLAAKASVASQICADMEGRDSLGDVFVSVYGDFLAEEAEFRTHAKLPNVIERLVASGHWQDVAYFNRVAASHDDTLNPDSRSDAFAHLRRKVGDRLQELGQDSPDELRRLDSLLSRTN